MMNTFTNGTLVNPRFENLTPHDVNLILPDGEVLTIPASGKVARVGSHVEQIGNIGAIPVVKTVFDTNVTDLPDPQDGVIYLTSTLVSEMMSYKKTLIGLLFFAQKNRAKKHRLCLFCISLILFPFQAPFLLYLKRGLLHYHAP